MASTLKTTTNLSLKHLTVMADSKLCHRNSNNYPKRLLKSASFLKMLWVELIIRCALYTGTDAVSSSKSHAGSTSTLDIQLLCYSIVLTASICNLHAAKFTGASFTLHTVMSTRVTSRHLGPDAVRHAAKVL